MTASDSAIERADAEFLSTLADAVGGEYVVQPAKPHTNNEGYRHEDGDLCKSRLLRLWHAHVFPSMQRISSRMRKAIPARQLH